MSSPTPILPDGIIELDGMLWKPRDGATVGADEFTRAREVVMHLHNESRWNPWVLDDERVRYDSALDVIDQWQRAEPGHHYLTDAEIDARGKDVEERCRRESEARKQERKRREGQFDAGRAEARLALLEMQSSLEHALADIAGYRDGSKFPGMDSSRRATAVAELDERIQKCQSEIAALAPVVGEPELVVDEGGWLPSERREVMLMHYTAHRHAEVSRLREELSGVESQLGAATDRTMKSELRARIADIRRPLDRWLAVPPLTADDMCSDCATPVSEHGWVTPPFDGPCSAWPRWAARLNRARTILANSIEHRDRAPVEPPAPKPQPLAVIPSGLPISAVAKRLQELEAQFPDAQVKRGRANRWELWPPEGEK